MNEPTTQALGQNAMGNDMTDQLLGSLMGFVLEQVPMMTLLIGFMTIDIITGFCAAWIKKEVSSKTSYNGMLKKFSMLSMVAAGALMEQLLESQGASMPMAKVVAGFLCLTEAVSITENAARAGVPMPQAWIETLVRLQGKNEQTHKPPSVVVGVMPINSAGNPATDRSDSGIFSNQA